MAGYAASLISFIFAMLNVLRLLTQLSIPFLTDPPIPFRSRHAPHWPMLIDALFLVFQLLLSKYAWRASSHLDAAAAKRAVQCGWIWICSTSVFYILAVVGLLVGSLPTDKGSAISPDARSAQDEAYQIMLWTVIGLIVLASASLILTISLLLSLCYFVWSLGVHIEKGSEQILVTRQSSFVLQIDP
eukprot:Gregarina_sp_Poly_1__3324@NODE_1957_length_2998_cov_35_809962_g1260_i0_p3_GENE_NODE_1957_length_2998_cov_35_809962_g1260_i0NODE_1957_length_2998_cov_35_809962_g1260_i0_p3_ORF_typecomplete_len187_score4_49Cyt_bd_oxida_II/PF02322_15/0_014ABC2_membrane_4/PF12730_7/1_1e03ABC2_membrane_4/PF12730_7/0_081Neurensin/PF14927_6/8_NODE_1957_length_2998_cov_35_809962_g1260_i056616